MASRTPGLTLEGNTWIVRVGVPADVRAEIGKSELIRSLQTGDLATAKLAYVQVHREFKRLIAEARGAPVKPVITSDDRRAAQMALAKWADIEQSKPLDDDGLTHTPWLVTNNIAAWEKAASQPDGWKAIDGFNRLVADMLTIGGMPVAANAPIIEVMRGEAALVVSYAERFKERARLEAAFQKRATAVRTADLDDVGAVTAKPDKALPEPSLTLQQLFDAWLVTLKVQEKEQGRLKHQIRRLIECVGDKPANHVERQEIIEFMGLVAKFPGRKRPPTLNAMSIRELVTTFEAENEARPVAERWKTLTKTTADEWFSSFNRMFEFGVVMEYENLIRNPFKGMRFAVDGAKSVRRRAYTEDEIIKIFTSPLYQGFAGDGAEGYRKEPGPKVWKDAKFWLPLLALFHGGRLSELAAMPLADFKTQKGADGDIHYFDLTDRSVKTVDSERIVPLHPHMKTVGWLAYVAGLVEAGETWLFPDLDHSNKQGPGHEFSKWWGNWCDAHGLTDPGIVYHSWRHAWKRYARASVVKEEIHDVISGHKGTSIGRRYGAGVDVEPLAREMALITFPEFPDLP